MPYRRSLILVTTLLALSGCRKPYTVPETPMPPNTILLSQMMRDLSAQPGFTDNLIKQIDNNGKKGPALLTPKLITELRKRILGNDWQGLDRFPGWTMREINPTVRVVGHEAGKNSKLEATSAVHPGAPVGAPGPDSRTRVSTQQNTQPNPYLDLGPYTLTQSETISLDQPPNPSTFPPFTTQGIVTDLGYGVTRGDGPNNLAPEHAESQRLADILNRLAANKLDGAQPFTATISAPQNRVPRVRTLGPGSAQSSSSDLTATTPQALIEALIAAGSTLTVTDTRYFANFGHFHFQPQGASHPKDVMMPFFVNSQLKVPGTHNRPLLIPVSHAELEWHIRGPHLNADVSYYFGIDGKSEWRTMDTLDQPWVLKRDAHTYTGAQAVEVTRFAGLLTVTYMHLHAAHPTIPFGGYYAFGVCQDGVSAIEKKMTGHVTLFPNTADDSFFNDPRDAEVNAMIAAIPKDRDGKKPSPERIFGSLPVAPAANANEAYNAVTIPGLAADLNATYAAWKDGTLEHTYTNWQLAKTLLFLGSAGLLAFYLAYRTHRFLGTQARQRKPLH